MKRFPIGLTLAVTLAFCLLMGLGLWQLHRLAWKEDLLARVAALRAAPARPIAEILRLAEQGRDVEYRRVSVMCEAQAPPARIAYRYALRDGQVGWRLISACRVATPPYDGVLLDRGLVTRFAGAMAPEGPADFAPPGAVVGVLRRPGGKPWLGPAETAPVAGSRVFRVLDGAALAQVAAESGLSHPVPYVVAVESEVPDLAGVVPAALPEDIPNNHLVYALTWFALGGVLLWFYGAMLLRRLNGR